MQDSVQIKVICYVGSDQEAVCLWVILPRAIGDGEYPGRDPSPGVS